jgi:hypothetical protein
LSVILNLCLDFFVIYFLLLFMKGAQNTAFSTVSAHVCIFVFLKIVDKVVLLILE